MNFEERIAARQARERRTQRVINVAVIAFMFCLLATIGLWFVTGEGRDLKARAGDTGSAAPSPVAPTISPEREDEFEKGLSGALVYIIATVADPAQGNGRAETVLANFVQLTGCRIADVAVHTAKHRARLDDLAVRKVEYAEPDWHDQYVGVTVEVSCG